MNRSPSRDRRRRARVATLGALTLVALVLPALGLSGSTSRPKSSVVAGHRLINYLLPHPEAYAAAKQAVPKKASASKATRSSPLVALPSWQGLSDSNVTPPDSTGAVGTTRYVELVNLKYGIYDRSGSSLSSGGLDGLTGHSTDGLSDPQVIWDPDTNRFYYAMVDFNDQSHIKLDMGFSKTNSPSTAADFCPYSVDLGYNTLLFDYPKLGDTSDFLLVGGNIFNGLFGGFVRSDVAWLVKPAAGTITTCPAALASGWPLATGTKQDLRNADNSQADTPIPANQTDPSSTGWVVSAYDSGNQINVFQVTKNVNGTANITGTATAIPVTSFSVPPNAPEKGSGNVLDTLDARLTQAVSAIDPAQGSVAIWTQHTISGGAGSVVRWYEINPSPAALFQSGTVSSASLYVFNGAIAPDRVVNGATTAFGSDMALGFNTSSSTAFPAIQMVAKVGTGAQSGFTLVKQSSAANVDFSCSPCRWGDYAGATPDPAADTSGAVGQVWFSNQWDTSGSSSQANWQTWNWAAAPSSSAGGGGAPTITSFTPTSGPVGCAVTITGTNFSDVSMVQFTSGAQARNATFTINLPTQLTATVPTVPVGIAGHWKVTNSTGSVTSTGTFTVTSSSCGGGGGGGAPTITGFTPTSGPPGTNVTITGTNFTNVTSVKVVTTSGGSFSVSFTVNSSTQITATVPSNAPHGVSVKFKVTTSGGSATSTNSFSVT